jgi:NADPH-dependent ferric siderophore reductase
MTEIKTQIGKHIFKVTSKRHLTPHYIRVTLRSDDAHAFGECTLGANNKIFIPPAGKKEVKFATFDVLKSEWVMPDEQTKPLVRTYTHRAINPDTQEITIDFVDHGESGPASAWARNAQVSDQLGVAMKIRPTVLYPTADWYLLVGDATAIPVLSCILESLPDTARGICIIEVPDVDDIHPEILHPGFEFKWLVNPHPEASSEIFDQVKEIDVPVLEKERVFAYVACEYATVRALRSYFTESLGWTKREYYAFSYWKAGAAEDQSAQSRREEKNANV